ncbi:MAG: CU044_5270 family protein [Candidatus Nanopelagicales bacterium]
MTTDLDQLLRAGDPAADVPAYDETRIAAALSRAVDEDALADVVPMPRPRRTRVRVAVAAAAAAAVLLVPVVSLTGGGAASPAAAAVLSKAASIGATDPVARPDQWYVITTTGFHLEMSTGVDKESPTSSSSWLVSSRRTEYVAVDGSRPSWVVETSGDTARLVAGAGDRPQRTTDAWTSNVAPRDIPSSWQVPSPAFLAALPRDVDALRERLYADTAGAGSSADGEVLVAVADVLRSGLVPADLRSSLYRVLETVPGVDVTSQSVRVGSATGVGIGRLEDVNGIRQELVVDPATGEVVAEREIAVRDVDGIPAGTVIGQTLVTRALVDAVPASVTSVARHDTCTVSPDNGVFCS